jgi:hypothetical protein
VLHYKIYLISIFTPGCHSLIEYVESSHYRAKKLLSEILVFLLINFFFTDYLGRIFIIIIYSRYAAVLLARKPYELPSSMHQLLHARLKLYAV